MPHQTRGQTQRPAIQTEPSVNTSYSASAELPLPIRLVPGTALRTGQIDKPLQRHILGYEPYQPMAPELALKERPSLMMKER